MKSYYSDQTDVNKEAFDAAYAGNKELVENLLIGQKADIKDAFLGAADADNGELISYLIDNEIGGQRIDINQAVRIAACVGNKNLTCYVIDVKGADVNEAFLGAAYANNVELIEYLVNERDVSVENAVTAAAYAGNKKLIEYLVVHGEGDVGQAAKAAVCAGNEELVEHLVAYGFDGKKANPFDLMFVAGEANNEEMKVCLKHLVDTNMHRHDDSIFIEGIQSRLDYSLCLDEVPEQANKIEANKAFVPSSKKEEPSSKSDLSASFAEISKRVGGGANLPETDNSSSADKVSNSYCDFLEKISKGKENVSQASLASSKICYSDFLEQSQILEQRQTVSTEPRGDSLLSGVCVRKDSINNPPRSTLFESSAASDMSASICLQ